MQDDARAVRSLFARRPASAPVRRTETGVHSTNGTSEPAAPDAGSQFVDLKAELHARVIADLQEEGLLGGEPEALEAAGVERRIEADGRPSLYRAFDGGKDQSYFLFATTPEQLDFLRFPLGAWPKSKTRELPEIDVPDGQLIVRAARVFDGVGGGYRENLDIVIEQGRIVALEARARPQELGGQDRLGVARQGGLRPQVQRAGECPVPPLALLGP